MSAFFVVVLGVCYAVVCGSSSLPPETLESCQADHMRLVSRVEELEAILEAYKEPVELAEKLIPFGTTRFYVNLGLALTCVTFAALAAGLTMGLVSINPMDMEILRKSEEKDIKSDYARAKLREDKECARRVSPLIHDHHRLLVTLLLLNSVSNEALPIFLDKLVPSWAAVFISVFFVLVFGEIIPSAIFTGSGQLKIASFFAPMVKILICIFCPIAWPIGKLLDILLGDDHKGRYNFAELRALVNLHKTSGDKDTHEIYYERLMDERFQQYEKDYGIITVKSEHGLDAESVVKFIPCGNRSTKTLEKDTHYYAEPCDPIKGSNMNKTFKLYRTEQERASLNSRTAIKYDDGDLVTGDKFVIQERDEIKIITGVMKLTHMTAGEASVPLREVKMVEESETLTPDFMKKVSRWGHSRLPVYEGHEHNLRGYFLVKDLITVAATSDSSETIKSLRTMHGSPCIRTCPLVKPDILMLDLLNKFQEECCHIAIITDQPDEVKKAWEDDRRIYPDVHMSGVITLEDIVEKMLQEDIDDEHDNLMSVPMAHIISERSITSRSPRLEVKKAVKRAATEQNRSIARSLTTPLLDPGAGQTDGRDIAAPLPIFDRDAVGVLVDDRPETPSFSKF